VGLQPWIDHQQEIGQECQCPETSDRQSRRRLQLAEALFFSVGGGTVLLLPLLLLFFAVAAAAALA